MNTTVTNAGEVLREELDKTIAEGYDALIILQSDEQKKDTESTMKENGTTYLTRIIYSNKLYTFEPWLEENNPTSYGKHIELAGVDGFIWKVNPDIR